MNVPNQLTLARLALAIVFFVLLTQYSQVDPSPALLDVSLCVFIVAAVTDFLDGYLARKHGQVTSLGRVMDPFVDKVLICGAFILLAGPGFVDDRNVNVTGVAPWMVVVIVGRELLVTGLRGFNESQGRPFPSSLHGKLKMWVQSIAAPVILLIVAHRGTFLSADWVDTVKMVFVYLTVIVTALSTIQYLVRSKHILDSA